MILLVKLDYNCAQVVKALSREDYMRLRDLVPTLQLPDWPEGKNEYSAGWYKYGETVCVTASDLPILDQYKLKYTVERVKNSFARTGPATDPGATYNTYNFALPNIGLLTIDEVTWRDDCCTEEIQNLLEDGWRIIAVCPPNGARRPDYILGRTKK